MMDIEIEEETYVEAPVKTYWGLSRLKKSFTDYQSEKSKEIDEQITSRKYYHGSQWTEEQTRILKKRKQPIVTKNRIARKIDGVVGTVERLRQDPKAFPRTPQHEAGADLATAVVRFMLDQAQWEQLSSSQAHQSAIDGIGGCEMVLSEGRDGYDIELERVEVDTFFYDPKSYRADFSDARYMGTSKWVDVEEAKALYPWAASDIDGARDTAGDLTPRSDKESRWFLAGEDRIRICEIWYKHGLEWCFAIFTGSFVIYEGESYFRDDRGRSVCKYIMFSFNVDQDGDRYGFIRNMRSSQDEINMRTSKSLHLINTKRLIYEKGAIDDVEHARREWARPDGMVEINPGANVRAEDTSIDLAAQVRFLEEAKAEIENFGPNPALIGTGVQNKSGRAISLLQQSGLAELGPFIIAYRGWKLRVYRALWAAAQQYWDGERWVRVTDDEGLAQFIQINGLAVDPITGMTMLQNAIGQLDVDIIMDEGPDSVNSMADVYDALQPLAQSGVVPPDVLIELAPGIDNRTRKRLLERLRSGGEPDPMALQAAELMAAEKQAGIDETLANAQYKQAQAAKIVTEGQLNALQAAGSLAMNRLQ